MTLPASTTAPLAPLPSLDELARKPEKVAGLPAAAVRALYPVAVRLEAELRSRLLVASREADASPSDDRALALEEAAGVLGMKPGTLYRKWRALGVGYKDADGHVKFTQAALERYLKRRGG